MHAEEIRFKRILSELKSGRCQLQIQVLKCLDWYWCFKTKSICLADYLDRVKRIWHLSPIRAPKVQASLRMRAVSPEPSLLAHTSSESRGTFRQKARSLAPLNSWACTVKICHDGMLEDTNSLDGAHLILQIQYVLSDSFKVSWCTTQCQTII